MAKFLRKYILTVETVTGELVVIKPPFTIEFDIQRNVLTSASYAQIRVYNLKENTRNAILKDQYTFDDIRTVELQAGYGDAVSYPIIFTGNIDRAWSVREGSNVITSIDCFDGGFAFANAVTNRQYPAGTPQKSIIEDIVSSLGQFNVSVGAIGNYEGVTTRGSSYSGNTVDVLAELTGGGFFIDNGKAYALQNNEVLESNQIQVIKSSSGLLGTPIREETYLRFTMLFEPRLRIGQQILLESITEKRYNTYYKVISLMHKGVISESIAGNATTEVGVFIGTQSLSSVGSAQ